MRRIHDFFNRRDRFAAHSGVELTEVGQGRAVARLRLDQKHLNGVDTAHGGAIFTLADLAFAAACNSHGTVAVAINASISYMKAAASGTLTAVAEETACNPRLGTYTVKISDDSGDLVAIFQGMAYRKRDRLLETADPADPADPVMPAESAGQADPADAADQAPSGS